MDKKGCEIVYSRFFRTRCSTFERYVGAELEQTFFHCEGGAKRGGERERVEERGWQWDTEEVGVDGMMREILKINTFSPWFVISK